MRCVDCQLAYRRREQRKKFADLRQDADETDRVLERIANAEAPPLHDEPTSWHAEATNKKPEPVESEFESVWNGRDSLIGDRDSVRRD